MVPVNSGRFKGNRRAWIRSSDEISHHGPGNGDSVGMFERKAEELFVTTQTSPKRATVRRRSTPEPAPRSRWSRIWRRALLEGKSLLPTWLFFFVSFSLLRATQTVILQEFGPASLMPPSKVLVGSLIVAKGVRTVDALRLFARMKDQPVILAALFKSLVYFLVAFAFQYSEAVFQHRHLGLSEATGAFVERMSHLHFWLIQVWLLILLFVYSATRTLAQRLGRGRFKHLFFGG
jgi:hypothetical protein